jgi:uncharacterized membrane protein
MLGRLARFGVAFVAISSMGVGLYSLRYFGVLFDSWLLIDEGIRGVVARVPLQALTHMLIAPVALLLGPLQFLRSFRAKYPAVHRYVGRVYVVSCLVAGVAALATAPHASGGPIAGLGFGILAVLWVTVTLAGSLAAVQRKIELHRLLMRFSYALTFSAVTLRLQIPVGFALGYTSYSDMSVWLAYTSWMPNVIIVALYSMIRGLKRSAAPQRTASAMTVITTGTDLQTR